MVAIALATLAILIPGTTANAANGCSADSEVLGQLPALTGPTPTDWFNVFGEGLDPAGTWTVTFIVPVMPWPLPSPLTYDPKKALSSLGMPSDTSGGFKWTVRTRDKGVKSLAIHVTDGTCTASHIAVLMPDTSTDPEPRDVPFALLPALIGAALVAMFRRAPRSERPRVG